MNRAIPNYGPFISITDTGNDRIESYEVLLTGLTHDEMKIVSQLFAALHEKRNGAMFPLGVSHD